MTLLIEVAPEVESVLQNRAAQRGQTLGEYMKALVERAAASPDVVTQKTDSVATTSATHTVPRLTAAAVRGKYAGRGCSVDDFLRERHEEAEVEERRFRERLRRRVEAGTATAREVMLWEKLQGQDANGKL